MVDLAPVIQASALNAVGNSLAFLQDFTTDFSDEYVSARKSTVKVPLLSGSSATTNPTSFGGGTSGASLITVSMNHVHVPFYISNAEYQNGYRLEQLIASNVQVMANYIQQLAFTPLLSSNYDTAVTVANTAFSLSSLQAAWASIPGASKVCYLDPTAYSKLLTNQNTYIDPQLGQPMAGFKRVAYTDSFTGAGTAYAYGFVSADKKGLVMASGIPEIAPKAAAMIETVMIDLGNGLTCAMNTWGDTADRSDNASLDLYFGAAVGSKPALKLIRSV